MKSFIISLAILIVITSLLLFGSCYLSDRLSDLLKKTSDLSEEKAVFADPGNKEQAESLESFWTDRKKVLFHCVDRRQLERIDLIFSDLNCAIEQENYMLYLVSKRDLEWKLKDLIQKQKVDFSLIL